MNNGRFGAYGGQYIPETLMNAVIELEEAYNHYKDDPDFCAELDDLLKNYAGRPSLLYYAEKMTRDLGGAKIYLKREDLNHTGSHKINNVLGQVLLAKKMGKTRVIAETGAGQHGVATATAAALMDMECEVFMGKEDTDRQALNCIPYGIAGRKGASRHQRHTNLEGRSQRDAARMDGAYVQTHIMCWAPSWVLTRFRSLYAIFRKLSGKKSKSSSWLQEGRLPSAVIACVGGGSNAMGAFYEFIEDKDVKLIGCEAAGKGVDTPQNAGHTGKWQRGYFPWHEILFLPGQRRTNRSGLFHFRRAGLSRNWTGTRDAV